MAVIITGCNKPGILGSDFVEEDEVDVRSISDFMFVAKTIERDPLTVYTNNFTVPNTFLLGEVNDPFLGRSRSEIYTQIDFSARKSNPFDSAMIDSVVLTLKYDTFGLYGTFEDQVTLSVFEMEEAMQEFDVTYKSNRRFTSNTAMPLGQKTFTPNPFDSLIVEETDPDTTYRLAPQLSIRLDVNYFRDKLEELDSVYWANPDTFKQEIIKGLHLSLDAPNTMLGLNFQELATTRLKVYYKPDTASADDDPFIFSFFMDEAIAKSVYYEHDYSGSLAGDILADSISAASDSIMFLQEMQGLSPEITIKGLDTLKGKLINSAILELSVARLPGDDKEMYTKPFLITAEQYGDTTIIDIIDTERAKAEASRRGSTSWFISSFGGSCEKITDNGQDRNVYRANITSHLQDVVDEGKDETVVIISSLLRPESPKRVLFYGTDTKHPVKLKVIYTDL